jgi:hypothetical protein
MAQTTLHFKLEFELLDDAVDQIARIDRALVNRHGSAFRDLERRIERLMEEGATCGREHLVALGPLRFVILPPREVTDLIDDAKRLGVL